jgi:hypothetical protein
MLVGTILVGDSTALWGPMDPRGPLCFGGAQLLIENYHKFPTSLFTALNKCDKCATSRIAT